MVDREAATPPYTLTYGFEAEVSIPPLPFQAYREQTKYYTNVDHDSQNEQD